MQRVNSPKFTKSVCLDADCLNTIEEIMEEFRIDSFSNAVRFCIRGYKQWRSTANAYKSELHVLKNTDLEIKSET